MINKIVIDSTVIIKWLNKNKENNLDKADKILSDIRSGKITAFAPELAKNELGKILYQNKNLSQTESKTPLSLLFELPIQFITLSPDLAKNAYAIAKAYHLSFEEGVYMALAEEKGAVFVTEIVNDKIRDTGVKAVFLKDY